MKLKTLIIISATSLLLGSCIKSKNDVTEALRTDKGSIVSEIFDASYYGSDRFLSLNATPPQETIDDFLTLRVYAARDAQPAGGKVHVKLEYNNSLVTNAGYTVLPANAFTISGLEFDVPANGEVKIPVTINKANMDLSKTYGLGFDIAEVSEGEASGLASSFLIGIGVKNKYDGRYRITGSMVDVTNANFVGTYDLIAPGDGGPLEWELWTSGPTQNIVYDNIQLGIPGHVFSSVGDPTLPNTYYGSFGLIINFDASDNVTSVTNYYGQPSGNGRSANLDPSGVNKYDPATKTIKIKYWLDQPAVITPHRTYFDETWTYVGPR